MQTLRHVDLQSRHTLAAPAWADCLIELDSPEEAALYQAGDHILGAGSNTVCVGHISSRLLHPRFAGIEIIGEDEQSLIVRALAGTPWHELVAWTVDKGLYGLENLALIYGSVGAAPVQNIGAYGVECADCLEAIEAYDAKMRAFVRIAAADCAFAYRQSRFKQDWKGRFMITAVHFRLHKQGRLKSDYPGIGAGVQTPKQMFERICALRRAKLPDPAEQPNAGSFFHNPLLSADQYQALQARFRELPCFAAAGGVKIPAAWLIEQCGFKGRETAGVGMSAQHALVLVNRSGDGRAILDYAAAVQAAVRERFAIDLVIEPEIIGDEHGN